MRYLKYLNEKKTAADDYYQSAIHYFNNNLNNDRALEYINNAIELSHNPYFLLLKKKIEERGPEPKFNDTEEQISALKDLCDTNLAYLKDDNFIVRVVPSRPDSLYIYIGLDGFNEMGQRDYFSWGVVKDHIIPFLHYLLKDFSIQYVAKGTNERSISFIYYDKIAPGNTLNEIIDVDEILNDEISDNTQIAGLSIYVKSEYFIT